MNELVNVFGQPHGPQSFDEIRISIASPERIRSWSYGEIESPKRSTTGRSSRNAMVCSVRVFSVRSRITNACAANTSA